MVTVVATGAESEAKLRAKGVEPGKIQSSVTTGTSRSKRSGGQVKTTYDSSGNVTRVESIEKTPDGLMKTTSTQDLTPQTITDTVPTYSTNVDAARALQAQQEGYSGVRTLSPYEQSRYASTTLAPSYKELLKTEEGRRKILERTRLKDIMTPTSQEEFALTDSSLRLKGLIPRLIENRQLLNKFREDARIRSRETKVQQLGTLPYVVRRPESSEDVFDQDIMSKDSRTVGKLIGQSFVEAGQYVKEQVSQQPTKPYGFVSLESADLMLQEGQSRVRPPSSSERAGLGMAGYTGGSALLSKTKVSPIIGKVIDPLLAAPDFARALVNPTYWNKAVAGYEILDVGTEFIPLPIPDVNVRVTVDAQLQSDLNKWARQTEIISPYFDAQSAPSKDFSFEQGGMSQAQTSYEASSPVSQDVGGRGTEIFSVAFPLVPPSTFRVDTTSDLTPTGTDFSVGGESALQTTTSSFDVVEPSAGGLDLSPSQGSSSPSSSPDSFPSQDVSVQPQVDADVQVDSGVDVGVSAGVDTSSQLQSAVQSAVNLDFTGSSSASRQASLSANLLLKRQKEKVRSNLLFKGFARERGVDVPVASGKDKRQVSLKTAKYVDNNASASYDVRQNNKLVPIKSVRGFYKRGNRNIELPSNRIDSPGEVSQISKRGLLALASKKIARGGLL